MALRFKCSYLSSVIFAYSFLYVSAQSDVLVDRLPHGGASENFTYEHCVSWRGDNNSRVLPICTSIGSYPQKKLSRVALVEEVDEYIQAIPQQYTKWHDALWARKRALTDFRYNCNTCEYVLSAQAQHMCYALGMSEFAYTQAYEGNSLDVALQQEARAILEHAACMALHPHLMHTHWLAESIVRVNDAGLFYTKGHAYQAAFSCFDWCWLALSTTCSLLAGTADGVCDGVLAALGSLAHPVDTLLDFVQSITALGWYTARILLCAATFHEPYMAPMRVQQLTDDALFLHSMAEHIYSEGIKLSAYSAARMISATLVEQLATAKLLHGISFFIRGAVKHASHMKRIPHAEQKLPALSGMPRAYQEAAVQGIEHGLSYLDWAGNDPSKASQKLRGYISKSHYAQRCDRIKAKALPALIATAQDLRISIPSERIAHVIWGELTADALGGCHTASGLKLHRLEQKIMRNLPGGAYEVRVKVGNERIDKTIFPACFSPSDVLCAVAEALRNPILKNSAGGTRWRIIGETQSGMMIESILEEDGLIVTAFPISKERFNDLKKKRQ